MQRKSKPKKKNYNTGRSQPAQDAWNRKGGVHDNQQVDHKKARSSQRRSYRDFNRSDWD